MQSGKLYILLSVATLLVFTWLSPAMAVEGNIAGTVSLKMDAGHVEPGNWIRILLVTKAVGVPKLDTALQPGDPGYVYAVNALHSGFYIQVQNHLAAQGYLVASTLTTDAGTFKIPAIPAGNYFILVKFPGNIHGYKVAWQVPVKVVPGKTAIVNLNRANLALPTVKR